jgi:hypothetical protein
MIKFLIKCTECLEEKSESEFHGDPLKINRRRSNCKKCENARCARYFQNNKEKRNAYQLERHHKRKLSDPMYILKRRYRNRLKKVFRYKGIVKVTSSMEFLGCTAEEFKVYFESLFSPEMNWDAVYAGKIHIDHIIPISTAKTEEELVKLSHYTNLQPLWAVDNLKKGSGDI